MLEMAESLTLPLPPAIHYRPLPNDNISVVITQFDREVKAQQDPGYEQFLADVWVGIVLTLMVLSCVCCMCSCLLYHKFQQWKRGVIEAQTVATVESDPTEVELPSYTIASGLPTYQEALEQLKKVKELVKSDEKNTDIWVPQTPPTPVTVTDIFQKPRNNDQTVPTKPT